MKALITTALMILLVAYLFWQPIESFFGFHVFEDLQALGILLMTTVIFMQNRKLFVSFFLLCASVNNLIDELLNQTDNLYITEAVLIVLIPAVWYLKTQRNVIKDAKR